MTIRLRLWLTTHDVAERLHLPRAVCMWLLLRAAAATQYEVEPMPPESDRPL